MEATSQTALKGRVLFVDDEPSILNALRRTFRNQAFEVATAEDGETALELFRVFRPTVVVADSRMPGMSGAELLAQVREIDPEVVRVVLTGCTDLPAAEEAINRGEVWRFLTKPWEDADLLRTVATANERYRLMAENRVLLDKLASIGLLAGGVAHELNNPLGGILAYTEILRREAEPALATDLRQIEDAALRAKKIVSELLDFARTCRNSERHRVTLGEIARKALAIARFQLRDIRIETEIEPSVEVSAEPNRLQQVVLNLLSNALDSVASARSAGRPAGLVILRVRRDGGSARLSVTDDGVGIPLEIQPRIFDPFFTTKAPGKGTGLGLPVSVGIAREHGGRIEVQSAPGSGATFVLSLPAIESVAAGATAN